MRFDSVSRRHDGSERRQWLRFTLPRHEELTLETNGRSFRCVIKDVSLGGARLGFLGDPPPPTYFELSHPIAGTFHGDCKWCTDQEIGLEFDQTEPSLVFVSHCLKQAVPTPRHSAA